MRKETDNVQKDRIRREIIRRLENQEELERARRSLMIQKKVLSTSVFRRAKTIMTYVSLPLEVSTRYLNDEALAQGKRVLVPYIDTVNQMIIASQLISAKDLEKGPLGIYQPKKIALREIPLCEIELIVVPAIAYDRQNMRLGRGKGYYDRFLAKPELCEAETIGLAFHFQIVEELPASPHDKSIDYVITDTEI